MAKSWQTFRMSRTHICCIYCGHKDPLPPPAEEPVPIKHADRDPVIRKMIEFEATHRDCEELRPAVAVRDRRGGRSGSPYPLAEEWDYQRGYSTWDSFRGEGARVIENAFQRMSQEGGNLE